MGKTYVELLLALPWDKVSPDIPADGREGQSIGESLERAREELEREHEGLEGVKKRVLEYLAVYRYVLNRAHWFLDPAYASVAQSHAARGCWAASIKSDKEHD